MNRIFSCSHFTKIKPHCCRKNKHAIPLTKISLEKICLDINTHLMVLVGQFGKKKLFQNLLL